MSYPVAKFWNTQLLLYPSREYPTEMLGNHDAGYSGCIFGELWRKMAIFTHLPTHLAKNSFNSPRFGHFPTGLDLKLHLEIVMLTSKNAIFGPLNGPFLTTSRPIRSKISSISSAFRTLPDLIKVKSND